VIAKEIVREEIDWKEVYASVAPPPEGEPQIGWESWGDYGPFASSVLI